MCEALSYLIDKSVGPLIGFFIGVAYAEYRNRRKAKKEKEIFLSNLHDSLKFNLDRINQMIGQLISKNGAIEIPNYLLDTDTIKSLLFGGRHFLDSQKIFDQLNWDRYQLDHINNKLTYIISAKEGGAQRRDYDSLLAHLFVMSQAIQKTCESWNKQT